MNHEAHTLLRESYVVTGSHFAIATNSQQILTSARKSFRQPAEIESAPDLTMRLWVDPAAQSSPPWPQPYFRGLSHLVYAGFDRENSVLLDLRRRRIVGRLSRSMAQDEAYWQRVVFPAIVGLVSDTLNVTVLHCGCVERHGMGLLLGGESGSGKSTLSLAMAQSGFAFLSDDWTYFSLANGELSAWGLATPVKLLPDAVDYFRELRAAETAVSLNGERAYEVDPECVFGIRRSFRCEPRWLVFLERQKRPGYSLVRMPHQEAARRLESGLERLPSELSKVRQTQNATIQSLVGREAWLLRHGENPREITQVLIRLCESSPHGVRCNVSSHGDMHFVRTAPDLTRRLTPTPYVSDLCIGGCTVRLETNSPSILAQVSKALDRYGWTPSGPERFLWRLVSDNDAGAMAPWPDCSSISTDGLELVNIRQRSFLAVDREARCAVGFLADRLVEDHQWFEEFFLARLFSMTMTA